MLIIANNSPKLTPLTYITVCVVNEQPIFNIKLPFLLEYFQPLFLYIYIIYIYIPYMFKTDLLQMFFKISDKVVKLSFLFNKIKLL